MTTINWVEGRAADCGAGRWVVADDGVMSYVAEIGGADVADVAAEFRSNYSAEQAAKCDVTLYVDGILA